MATPDALRPRRRSTVSVDVGGVLVGSAHPIVVQSMTNTDTADPDATAIQVARLAHAGSQLVRVTVNTEEAAAAAEGSTISAKDLESLGGVAPPLAITPEDHEGGGWVQVFQAKGGKLVKATEWEQAYRDVLKKHLDAESKKAGG